MTTHFHPLVSIVVPCFNQGEFVTACLESVLSQSLHEWEAVVVDDASDQVDIDQIVRGLNDARFRVVRHETNRGQGAARNTGFREARAPLVVPVDSDDVLEAEFLSATTSPFHDAEAIDCVFTDFRLFGSSVEEREFISDLTLRDMLLSQWIPGAGTLMRRTVWERVIGYCEERELIGNEDWDFWISALAGGLNVAHVPLPLYRYRQHEQSVSSFALRNNDHLQRELLYRRHRSLYDQYHVGGKFRATGYLNSAAFSWKTGERRRALRIARMGLSRRHVAWPLLKAAVRATLHRRVNRDNRRRASVVES